MFDLTLSNPEPQLAPMFVDGRWLQTGGDRIEVENPANEAVIALIEEASAADAADAVMAARKAQVDWAGRAAIDRAGLVTLLADAVDKNQHALARLVTLEQGKPHAQALGEVGATSTFLRYAAAQARRIKGDLVTSDNPSEEISIRRHPYGVVVGLTAWNYPSALAARKAGPALVAGNTFVLLSHEITPLSGLALASLADGVGFPPGVFNVITGRGPVAGKALVESPDTAMITMTGSTRAGREIYRSGAERIKVIRLELGGKAPFIVMEDADVDAAVKAAVQARYTNCGQVCTCNERMYLHKAIADEFLEKFVDASRSLRIGNPLEDVDLGPKVSGPEVDKVARITERSVAAGAELLLEGGPLDDGEFAKGHWMAPTVLEVADNTSAVVREEVFGPVVAAQRIDDFDQAMALANDTEFGLSAYLFTKDYSRLMEAPRRLNFGELYLNRSSGEAVQGFHTGWGLSGLGGEDGEYGFDGYLRKQTSYLNWG